MGKRRSGVIWEKGTVNDKTLRTMLAITEKHTQRGGGIEVETR